MTRPQTSLAVLGAGVLSPSAFFVILAGILLAAGISGAGGWIARRAGVGRGWGGAALLFGILAAMVAVALVRGPTGVDGGGGCADDNRALADRHAPGPAFGADRGASGVRAEPLLGLIAGLLGFVPNIGPIPSAIPAVLLASTEGGTAALLTVGVVLLVQALESYLITPKVQQDQVSLPPALLISAQVVFGLIFGLAGLLFAGPLLPPLA